MKLVTTPKKLALATMLLSGVSVQSMAAAELEEVVVTAQKRSESMQDIPIAMSAYSADNIQAMGLHSAKDIGMASPSLQMPTYPTSSNNLALFIRGVGSADSISLTKDNTVGVYYDGVYAGRSTGLLADLADLERVEILRGPQGTLYGRNTTSGAINFINAKPTGEFGLKQSLTVGDMGIFRSVTNLNLPAVAGFKVKLTAAISERDGWVENDGANKLPGGVYEDFYSEDKEGFRFAVRYDGVENLVIDYAYDLSDMDTTPAYFQYSGPVGGADGNGNPITNSYTSRLEETRTPTGGINYAYYLPLTETEVEGHNLTVTYDINDHLTFKSITGYREFDDNLSTNFAQSFGGAFGLEVNTITEHEQLSQEFQLIGSGETISYVAGLYYLKEEGEQSEKQFLSRETVDLAGIEAIDNATGFPCGDGSNAAPLCSGFIPFFNITPLLFNDYAAESDVESSAVFGQATWTPPAAELENKLDLTLGLRYTKDERESERFSNRAWNGFLAGEGESDLSKTDWSVVADYKWTDNVSTYLKAATAFRSGGAGRNSGDYSQFFDEETLISYEFGWKAEMLDRRLRINGAIYQMEIDDIILDYLPDPVNAPNRVDVINSGEATINGFELDVLAALTESFTIGFNYAYLDYEFNDVIFPDGTDHTDTTVLVWAPENAYSFIADYNVSLAAGELRFHLDYSRQDEQFALANTDEGEVEVEAFDLMNARISLADVDIAGAKWQFGIWSRNVLDERVSNYRIGTTATTYLQPRTVGADVMFEF
ncbi:TonB-dependent receptor [Oceanicoccus sp. KOV_DT_Chl]|uniref:TonB-dependent receptor n=1 Tax=Oceanicoccus sp. KOV_DT_Chl TaxID=1904639 RepID=UPI000C7995F3|nr:TonB-dependent receptor [Oceanicoccus sp. KOV_DT_Chl]